MKTFDDDPGPWTVLAREYLAREPWYTVRVDRVQLPTGAIIPKYWISEYPPWVNVVAVTADERVVLIRQYRHGIGAVHFEIPAGATDPGDTSLESAARRELLVAIVTSRSIVIKGALALAEEFARTSKTSRTSSRGGVAPTMRPSGSSVGKSFKL